LLPFQPVNASILAHNIYSATGLSCKVFSFIRAANTTMARKKPGTQAARLETPPQLQHHTRGPQQRKHGKSNEQFGRSAEESDEEYDSDSSKLMGLCCKKRTCHGVNRELLFAELPSAWSHFGALIPLILSWKHPRNTLGITLNSAFLRAKSCYSE
jgi:hypothetical protein